MNQDKLETTVGVRTAGTEGSSVTLQTDGQEYKQITWMFGPQKWIIARCNIRDTPLCEITDETSLTGMNLSPEQAELYKRIINSFRDRLKIHNNGSLTIKNISDEQAGLYTLQIINKSGKEDKKEFSVNVSAPKIVNDSKCSECVCQCSVEHVTRVSLSWIISSTAPFLEVEYQDTNGNCVVNNSVTDLTKHCQCMSPRSDSESGLSPWLIGVLVLLGVAVVAAAAVIFYKNFYKKCKAEQNGKYYLQSTQIV
ncbi:uncharacterized protein LOC125254386 isoform X2 [Megalobrama amblycephala]|uniref:uncharacterized protein LOC125254386 isoform X2 n=1 Tax=Megalobrama amblycephala TaxID=75352 RepID=UPI0020144EC0|nr:uncharacterized protein LOC125254386 isoform X2 [Megalobrama amblycephala]